MKKFTKIGLYALIAVAVLLVAALTFFRLRQMLVKRQIENHWAADLPNTPVLTETSELEILPLYEEAGSSDMFIIGHGVSYIVRTDSATVLLDVGHNPDQSVTTPMMQNMQTLGITPDDIDAIVISHPHPDHLGGVSAWRENTISFGKSVSDFENMTIYVPSEMRYPGVVVSREPVLVSADVATTGVIAYLEVFPLSLYEPKGVEQALVVHVAGEGLVLITGCGHPGLEKLIARAEALYQHPVVGVVGGLHYGDADASEVAAPIQYLQSQQPKLVAVSPHDSGEAALDAFNNAFSGAYHKLQVGKPIQFP